MENIKTLHKITFETKTEEKIIHLHGNLCVRCTAESYLSNNNIIV